MYVFLFKFHIISRDPYLIYDICEHEYVVVGKLLQVVVYSLCYVFLSIREFQVYGGPNHVCLAQWKLLRQLFEVSRVVGHLGKKGWRGIPLMLSLSLVGMMFCRILHMRICCLGVTLLSVSPHSFPQLFICVATSASRIWVEHSIHYVMITCFYIVVTILCSFPA